MVSLPALMANEDLRSHIDAFIQCKNRMRIGTFGATPQLWVTYTKPVQLLLQFINAIKEMIMTQTWFSSTQCQISHLQWAWNIMHTIWHSYGDFSVTRKKHIQVLNNCFNSQWSHSCIIAVRSFTPGSISQIDRTDEETIISTQRHHHHLDLVQ